MSPQQRERLSKASKSKTVIGQDSATQILAIASGKGGVGKSTVTVNLAVALHNAGHKVGIIDCDVYGFSIPRMMGVEHVTPVIRDEKIVPVEAHGMRVISVGNFVEGNTPVIWRGPMLSKILEQFLSDVDWGELDYLLLDLPPGTGDVALDVVRLLPKSNLILVTTPQAVAAGVASRAGQMALKTNQRLLGVVENMSVFVCPHCGEQSAIFGEGGGRALAEELGVELLGQIPLTLEARMMSDEGIPAALVPNSIMQESYAALAERVKRLLDA
ncbi:MAG: Mrp/NBP35 family ATP-binding protein [Firmicutes bacterium]|nr:Mrp/NBP35 family ATP-binding protein [Bacillota bacterium]